MLESRIQTNCMNWYKKTYPYYIKKNEQLAKSGDPDIIICHNGLFVAIEMKRPGGKPTKLQEIKLKKIGDSRGIAAIASSLDEFKKIIDYADVRAKMIWDMLCKQ